MRAVVWHGKGDIHLNGGPEPTILEPIDALIRLTASATCDADLHSDTKTFIGMVPSIELDQKREAGWFKTQPQPAI